MPKKGFGKFEKEMNSQITNIVMDKQNFIMNNKTTKILPLGLLLLVKNYFSSCFFHNTSLVHSSSGY